LAFPLAIAAALAIAAGVLVEESAADLENLVFTSRPYRLRMVVPRGWRASDQASYPGQLLWVGTLTPTAHQPHPHATAFPPHLRPARRRRPGRRLRALRRLRLRIRPRPRDQPDRPLPRRGRPLAGRASPREDEGAAEAGGHLLGRDLAVGVDVEGEEHGERA